ncbi:family 16 glycosylhydrolase [Agaribacter flavus]|uniref:Family 16 glycosylhydrolase n=1 Tax=Agaribacter flavus TaxID=1902781 RepID=A0ABV7FUI6_9ALTE
MIRKSFLIFSILILSQLSSASETEQKRRIQYSDWQLTWSDEFNYPDEQLDENWISQNGPTENPWVLSSRWRENAVVKDGILHLVAKKESRGGQDWTTGNVWSKRQFHYGYFEARYKIAAAYGTNNSFWFWPKKGVPAGMKACEIDVNEGHYPNIINTNIHNWTDKFTLPNGRVSHSQDQLHHTLAGKADHTIVLEVPITTNRIRLRSQTPSSIHMNEFRVYAPAVNNVYPNAFDNEAIEQYTNLALAEGVTLRTNGIFNQLPSKESYAIDGKPDTRWVSAKSGDKLLELTWKKPVELGAVQFVNGWLQEYGAAKGAYRNLLSDYQLEYHNGEEWVLIERYDAADIADYSSEFQIYGLEWDKDYFRFYLNGELFHEMRNEVCFSETTMLFSLAILKAAIAGPVTDNIDGTSMAIDWVRYYTKKP